MGGVCSISILKGVQDTMWKYMQCAVRGRGHERTNTPCQDKTYIFDAYHTRVIALADGAGSAKLSHYGAECVSENICRLLAQNFDIFYDSDNAFMVKKDILSNALIKLEKLASNLGCTLQELASTLLFAAIKQNKFILGHIGDGVIGYSKNGIVKVASCPHNGEFANMTTFVTSASAIKDFRLFKGTLDDGIDGFVLMSDGTETSFYDKKKQSLSTALASIMDLLRVTPPRETEQKVNVFFHEVIRKNTLDDCSIIVFVNNHDLIFPNISSKAKLKLFGISNGDVHANRRIRKYQGILCELKKPKTMNELRKVIHMREKILRKCIHHLMDINLVECHQGRYVSVLEYGE